MPKSDTTETDETGGGKDRNAADKNEKQPSDEGKDAGSDSSSELEAVRSKKGEPPDNLRRRAEWFQKRTGGGS